MPNSAADAPPVELGSVRLLSMELLTKPTVLFENDDIYTSKVTAILAVYLFAIYVNAQCVPE